MARFNGSTWTATVVDPAAVGGGEQTSLAFGPDGQPAISYFALGGDLKYATKGIFRPAP
jgi:hypothetical protein